MVGALRTRTSDRSASGQRAAVALAKALDLNPTLIGTADEPVTQSWEQDLAGCHEALRQAREFIVTNDRPMLVAPHCSIAIATLPSLPEDVRILWLDAHGDFHTPETTESGFLGGMPLAAVCGLWSAGEDYGSIDPSRVLLAGVRDTEASERGNLADAGIAMVAPSDEMGERVVAELAGSKLFVHLDFDVVDPEENPAAFSAPGGISFEALQVLCEGLARECEIVGCEATALEDPARASDAAACLQALLA